MKAIVCRKYGSPDVLELSEIEKPIPTSTQVLVNIKATSLNYGNLVLLKGSPFLARFAFGLFKPKFAIPGGDIAGVVEAVGNEVKNFQPGDEVFGDLSACGWGGFAEYVAVPENALAIKPVNLSFEEAAAVPMAGVTALQAIKNKGKIQSGQKVLINGASGGVGTFAVQIAKAFGAEVTGVCSTRNIDILQSIGADQTIDYTLVDFKELKESFDLIIAVNGYQAISTYKRALNANGNYVMVGGSGSQLTEAIVMGPWMSMIGSKKMSSMLHRPSQHDLILLKELIEEGKLKPIIDQCYKLSEIAEAFTYFEKGHAQGKVIITV